MFLVGRSTLAVAFNIVANQRHHGVVTLKFSDTSLSFEVMMKAAGIVNREELKNIQMLQDHGTCVNDHLQTIFLTRYVVYL